MVKFKPWPSVLRIFTRKKNEIAEKVLDVKDKENSERSFQNLKEEFSIK